MLTPSMPDNKKRIHLLSKAEIDNLYSLPQFNQDERRYYFNLSKSELNNLGLYKNAKTRLYFILQLGYFKATQQFYSFNFEDVKADIRFISQTYFQIKTINLNGKISRNHNQKQKENILKLFDYCAWSEAHSPQIEFHLCELVRMYPKTHNAFRELLVYFEAQKIVIPSYRILQDIFTKVFRIEKKRTSGLVLSFPKHLQKQLADLISHEDGLTQLNIMRADQKDFQYTALKLEVEKAHKLSELYLFCKLYIPKLKLSKNAIRYYADLTDQYAPVRLRRLSKAQRFLHLTCFVYHRYQQFMDNLIITFMYHVRSLLDAGKSYADMAFLQHSSKLVVDFPKLAQFLKWFPSQEKTPEITYAEFSQKAYILK